MILGGVTRYFDHSDGLHHVRGLFSLLVTQLQQDKLDWSRSLEKLVALLAVVVAEEGDGHEPILGHPVGVSGLLQLLLDPLEKGINLELLSAGVGPS